MPFLDGFRSTKLNCSDPSSVDKRCGQGLFAEIRTGRVLLSTPRVETLALSQRKGTRKVTRNWRHTFFKLFLFTLSRLWRYALKSDRSVRKTGTAVEAVGYSSASSCLSKIKQEKKERKGLTRTERGAGRGVGWSVWSAVQRLGWT